MKLVDSHCHLDHEKYQGDLDAVLERAAASGVDRMLCIGTGDGPPDLEHAIELARRYPRIMATVGVHPHDADSATPATFDALGALLKHEEVVALGEIGLDYHYDLSPREVQRDVFVEQMRLAREASKPIIIHTREAWDDTLALIREHWRSRTGIMHCFTGDAAQARQALDLGFLLGFGGVITFPRSESLREALRQVPDDRLLVETDCPYLAPVPHRGKRNEPAFIMDSVRAIAAVRGTTAERIAEITTANFDRFCLRVASVNEYTESSPWN